MRTVRRHNLQENFQRGVYDAHPPGMDNFIYKAQISARKIVDNACCNCFEGEKIGRFRAKNAQRGVYGNTLPKLPIHCYHNTREVATHENPERTKDEHSAGSSKPVSNRSPWQELNPASQRPEIGSKQAICAAKPRNRWRKCVPRPCARAHRSICAGGRLYV